MKLFVAVVLFPLLFLQGAPAPTPLLSTDPDVLADINTLLQTPILYNMDTLALHDIFQRGQEMGNHANVFTKIGDSNTTSGDFLQPFAVKHECDLGDYADLQTTIDYFAASYDGGQSNSFNHASVAAQNGLSSTAMLDPMWAGDTCAAGENPVSCEYRHDKPSIAVIMIGLMDTRYDTDITLYHDNLEQVVQYSIDRGVIPVLTTIIVLPDQETLSFDQSIRINTALLDLADGYRIPLINLWAAVQSLPDYGIGPDRTHLKQEVGAFCDFTGAEQEIGSTLRNLLTLQALDTLRKNVIEAP